MKTLQAQIKTAVRKNDLKQVTEIEKRSKINYGQQFISLEEYKKRLEYFGLKLIIQGKYYNNYNSFGSWLECMVDAEDETKNSYANIYGRFYQEEAKKETAKYREFREFRNNYFTATKSGHLINI